jgi:recombinational DNA repair protein (RecF pathway)
MEEILQAEGKCCGAKDEEPNKTVRLEFFKQNFRCLSKSVLSRIDNIKDQAKDVLRAFLQEYSKKSAIKSRMKQYYSKSKLCSGS